MALENFIPSSFLEWVGLFAAVITIGGFIVKNRAVIALGVFALTLFLINSVMLDNSRSPVQYDRLLMIFTVFSIVIVGLVMMSGRRYRLGILLGAAIAFIWVASLFFFGDQTLELLSNVVSGGETAAIKN